MKKCEHCGAKLREGATVCLKCGYLQNRAIREPVYLDPAEAEFPVISMSDRDISAPKAAESMAVCVVSPASVPAARLKTNRGLLKFVLLSIITCGIYGIAVMADVSMDINIVAGRYDGKRTMPYGLVFFIFSWLTLGIVPLVWSHRISGRIGAELTRRGISYRFGSGTFWGWGFFGSLILVGPFIYAHKLLKSMNLLAADYNVNG